MQPTLKIRSIAKRTIHAAVEARYHAMHKKHAQQVLHNIELDQGKLPPSLKAQCDHYAQQRLGHRKYAPWLYVYAAMQGTFKDGWLPCNYYGHAIVRDIDQGYGTISDLKPLTNRLLLSNQLPDLLYVNNGYLIEPNNYHIVSNARATQLLFDENSQVIFKPNASIQGKGVRLYSQSQWAQARPASNGVVQKIIQQHDFFDALFPHPGATLRITTGLDATGQASVRAAYLRLGRSQHNSATHVQSNSAVRIAVDLHSGALANTGYLANWRSCERHPDSHAGFQGQVIPVFAQACRTVEQLHNRYPFVLTIGWDVSINQQAQVEIMEWNTAHNDIKFSEASQGPCFKDILDLSLQRP